MKKMDKLREVNENLQALIIDLQYQLFVETENDRNINCNQPIIKGNS